MRMWDEMTREELERIMGCISKSWEDLKITGHMDLYVERMSSDPLYLNHLATLRRRVDASPEDAVRRAIFMVSLTTGDGFTNWALSVSPDALVYAIDVYGDLTNIPLAHVRTYVAARVLYHIANNLNPWDRHRVVDWGVGVMPIECPTVRGMIRSAAMGFTDAIKPVFH